MNNDTAEIIITGIVAIVVLIVSFTNLFDDIGFAIKEWSKRGRK